MADIPEIENIVKEIHKSIENQNEPGIDEVVVQLFSQAEIIVTETPASSSVNVTERTLHCSLLFQSESPPDALQFLTDTVNADIKSLKKGRLAGLKLITKFIKHLSGTEELERFAALIRDACWTAYSKETVSQDVKAAYLRPIRALLKLKLSCLKARNWAGGPFEMARSLFDDVRFAKSSVSQTVKGEMLKLISVILTEYATSGKTIYDQNVYDMISPVLDRCEAELERNFGKKVKKPELKVVAGCFCCIEACVAIKAWRFTEEAEEEEQSRSGAKLYRCLSLALQSAANQQMHDYEVPAKALRFFVRRPSLLRGHISKDAMRCYQRVQACMALKSPKVIKHAQGALEAIVGQIGKHLSTQENAGLELHATFLAMWLSVLESPSSDPDDLRVATLSLAAFAPSIGAHQGEQEGEQILHKILQCCDRQLSASKVVGAEEESDSRYSVTKKVDYLHTTASILRCLPCETSPPLIIAGMEQLCHSIILAYPILSERDRKKSCVAMTTMLASLHGKVNGLSGVLSRVLNQGLTQSLLRTDAEDYHQLLLFDPNTGVMETRLCFVYFEMFGYLLRPNTIGSVTVSQLEKYGEVAQLIYGQLMQEVLGLLRQLNLSYSSQDTGLVPHKAMDQELFLNLVTLLEMFLPKCLPQHLLQWVPVMCSAFIELSLKLPYLSGFYKLVRVVLDVCDSHDYFTAERSSMEIDNNEETKENNVEQCALQLRRYLTHTAVALSQFKDELLAACLSLVLGPIPGAIVSREDCLPALKVALKTGASHLPSAEVALSFLIRWREEDMESLVTHLQPILALLEPYLFDAKRLEASKKEDPKVRGRKGIVKATTEISTNAFQSFQGNLVRFLGRLGGHAHGLAVADGEGLKRSLAWDPIPRVKLEIPFNEAPHEVEIYLDPILPRLVELAEQKGHRQTKTLASECLHALILYMVGKSAVDPTKKGRNAKQDDYHALYVKIFPTLIRLAVDVEAVTRQLFETLVMQLIHWYSNASTHNEESSALLDALTAGLSGEEPGPLRQLCAKGVSEFLRYAIKQTTKKEMATMPVAVNALLTRIFSLATHPDKHKRLGAALAFNQIYRHLREETSLLHRYALQILHIALISLRRANEDHVAIGTTESISNAVDHMIRTIKVSVDKHNDRASLKSNSKERVFPHSLEDLIEWIWDHTGSPETAFRRKCMECICALTPLLISDLPGVLAPYEGAKIWMKQKTDDLGVGELVRVFEGANSSSELSMLATDSLFEVSKKDSKLGLLKWMEHLASSLDAYSWVLDTGMIDPLLLLDEEAGAPSKGHSKKRKASGTASSTQPHIFRSLQKFVEFHDDFVAPECNLAALKRLLPTERDMLKQQRARLLRRMLNFLSQLVSKAPEVAPSKLEFNGLWSLAMQKTVLYGLACPWKGAMLMRPTEDDEVEMYLPAAAERFLSQWKALDSVQVRGERLGDNLPALLRGEPTLWLTSLELGGQAPDLQGLMRVIRTYHVLHRHGILVKAFPAEKEDGVSALAAHLTSLAFALPAQISPLVLQAAASLLNLALTLGIPIFEEGDEDTLHGMLLDSHNPEDSTTKTRGGLFYERFHEEIHQGLLKIDPLELERFLVAIVNDCNRNSQALNLLEGILDYIKAHPTQVSGGLIKSLQPQIQDSLQNWTDPELATVTMHRQAIRVIKQLLDLGGSMNSFSRDLLFKTLQHSNNNIVSAEVKAEALKFLLPAAVKHAKASSDPVARLRVILDAIDEMVAHHFPLNSREVSEGTQHFSDYTLLLRTMLEVLANNEDMDLLPPLFPTLREGPEHKYGRWIRQSLKALGRRVSKSDIRSVLKSCYWNMDQILSERVDMNVKKWLFEYLLLPMIQKIPTSTFEDFIIQPEEGKTKSVLKQLIDNISVPPGRLAGDWDAFGQICAYALLELVYDRIEVDNIKGKLTKSFAGDGAKGTELTVAISKAASKAAKTPADAFPSGVAAPIRLQLSCSSFSCLCMVVALTQTQEKFFEGLIFKDKADESFWSNVVDTSKKYKFAIETDPFPLVPLRSKTGEVQPEEEKEKKTFNLQSQILLESSLSQQTGPMGISSMMGGSQDNAALNIEEENYTVDEEEDFGFEVPETEETKAELESKEEEEVTFLEMNEVNKEQCMRQCMFVMERMKSLFQEGWDKKVMPRWMAGLRDRLADDSLHLNVRLYILRMVTNKPLCSMAAPYASQWLAAILEFCVAEMAKVGEGFHYYLRDVCSLLSEDWQDCTPKTHETRLAADFISYLIQVTYHLRGPVVRQNLRAIDSLLTKWYSPMSSMHFKLACLVDLLKTESGFTGGAHATPSSKGSVARMRRTTGLNLFALLLKHSYPILSLANAQADGICSWLINGLTFPRKEVFVLSAEACGMALTHIEDMKKKREDLCAGARSFSDRVNKTVLSAFSSQDTKRFILMLQSIAAHHPDFVDREIILKGFSAFAHVDSQLKSSFLAVLVDMDPLPDLDPPIFMHLHRHLPVLLTDTSTQLSGREWVPLTQLLTLRLLKRLIPSLQKDHLGSLLSPEETHSLLALTRPTTPMKSREMAYEILMQLYDRRASPVVTDFSEVIRTSLLRGLRDPDDSGMQGHQGEGIRIGVRRQIYEYWTAQGNLSEAPIERLVTLMNSMFHPDCSDDWLHYSCYMLLALTERSRAYEKKLFDKALSDCAFRDMVVDGKGGFQARPMTPLFSMTTQSHFSEYSQSQDMSGTAAVMGTITDDVSQKQAGYLRATQDYTWTQTQGASGMEGYVNVAYNTQVAHSRLLFDVGSSGKETAQGRGQRSQMPPPAPVSGSSSSQSQRRRIIKNTKGIGQLMQAEIRRKRIQARIKQGRDSRVVIYRKYREGELPDIQIPLKDLLRPIQALCMHDALIAREMLVALYAALWQTGGDGSDHLGPSAQRMLKSAGRHTDLVATLHSACRKSKGLELPVDVLAQSALQSLNFHSGILLVEESLLRKQTEVQAAAKGAASEARKKKRRSGAGASTAAEAKMEIDQEAFDADNQDAWLQLSKLYQALGEKEILMGLAARASRVSQTTEALEAEMAGDFNRAMTIYNELADTHYKMMEDGGATEASRAELLAWDLRSVGCLVNVGRWTTLYDSVLNMVETKEEIWEEGARDNLMGFYMASLLNDPSKNEELNIVFDQIFGSSPDSLSRRSWMEQELPVDLVEVCVRRGDWGRARIYVDSCITKFLEKWGGLHVCAVAARRIQLQTLQRIVELEDIISFETTPSNFESAEPMKKMLHSWCGQEPSKSLDNATIWNDILRVRRYGLEEMVGKIVNDPREASGRAWEHLGTLYLHTSQAAIQQGVVAVAKRVIKEGRDMYNRARVDGAKPPGLPTILAALDYNKAMVDRMTNRPDKQEDIAAIYEKSFGFIEHELDQDPTSLTRMQLLGKKARWSLAYAESVVHKKGRSASQFVDQAKESYEAAVLIGEELVEREVSDRWKEAADASAALASFCDRVLSARKSSEDTESCFADCGSGNNQLAEQLVVEFMKALRWGSKVARERIPRVLDVLGIYPATRDHFERALEEVPEWMFLGWTAQIMGLLEQAQGDIISVLLVKIAKKYPRALYYAWRTAEECLSPSAVIQNRVSQLRALLSDPSMEAFVDALNCLTHPEMRWMDALKKIWKLFGGRKPDLNTARQELLKAKNDCLEIERPRLGLKIGSYNREFAKSKLKREVDKDFGVDCSKINEKSIKKHLNSARMAVGSIRYEAKPALARFSQWLSDFEPEDHFIEIPGQYTGNQKPHPDLHARIMSFDQSLLMLASLRKPKRLKVHANDEQDYMFLVKGGEDLRQDERIEQLFEVMNQIFAGDALCAQSRLLNRTYKVIPMTTKVGLVEWVQNTMPFKAILEEEMAHDQEFISIKANNAREANGKVTVALHQIQATAYRQDWLRGNTAENYHKMFIKASRDRVVGMFDVCKTLLPDDFLRRRLISMAPSPEAFLTLRADFAKSLAVFNISSYVLGIGDRHLDNYLMDLSNGELIGIDFGMAFGLGASQLPVPEFIPFRMTQQFSSILKPLDSVGLLKCHMVNTLAALRRERNLLMNTMEVFLNEPIVDWTGGVAKHESQQGAKPEDWEPARKIQNALRKLEGYNPVVILWDDLEQNAQVKARKSLQKLKEITKGTEAAENARAAASLDEPLSVTSQVECLLDLATDSNVLGRQWSGLATWV